MRFEDEELLVAISQDEKFQRFYSEADCNEGRYRELTNRFIEQAHEAPRKSYQLAIEHKSDKRFIGTVGLRLEDDSQASIGCALSRFYQGRSLAQEAAKAVVDFGFSHLGVHRVYAETISENTAAINICTSLGMRREAHLREHRYFKERWWDTVIMALLSNEWVKKASTDT
jgi:RimJ/RimL family protein N-acetyltransferase